MAKTKTYSVQMLQGWRETLMNVLRPLGFIEGAGYAEGSTVWRVAITTPKFKTPEALSAYLRKELNVDGYLCVDEFDWSE